MNFLTQLRSLSLDLRTAFDFSTSGNLSDYVEWTIQTLRHLASPHLQELTITLSLDACSDEHLDVWDKLCLLLESAQFLPSLRSMDFRFRAREFQPLCMPLPFNVAEGWIDKLRAARGTCAFSVENMVPSQSRNSLE
jgi:hypothetical protein